MGNQLKIGNWVKTCWKNRPELPNLKKVSKLGASRFLRQSNFGRVLFVFEKVIGVIHFDNCLDSDCEIAPYHMEEFEVVDRQSNIDTNPIFIREFNRLRNAFYGISA